MSEKSAVKFRVKVDKMWGRQFSIGIAFSHWDEETYLYISFIKWTIAIGLLYAESEVPDADSD